VNPDVRRWLETNGFGHYGDVFEAQQIDMEVLPQLTEQHLREMGIPLGPSVKLMNAIGRLCDSRRAERRRMTVMFVDLVGSTALSVRLDPEDLRPIITTYHSIIKEKATLFQAHVAQYFGDGALIYFGYPQAQEDAAQRSVLTALRITRALATMQPIKGERLAARIGIATGLVVVGDVLSTGMTPESWVIGETPNLAARLQQLAAPGEIIVSGNTRALLGNSFEMRDLGPQTLRGIPTAVAAYQIIGESVMPIRFDARPSSQPNTLVGRQAELARLQDQWSRVRAGCGQVVLTIGEAGIGKSRLIHALLDSLADEPHIHIRNQCSPHHTDSPLFPISQQIMRAAGFLAADGMEAKLDRLETLLGRTEAESMGLIAAVLGLDSSRYGPLAATPQQQRVQTFDALTKQLARLARDRPVVWILEDAHWVDPTTLELLQRSLSQVQQLRLMIILTARPEFSHDLSSYGDVQCIELGRLDRRHAEDIVTGMTPGKRLPPELVAEIVGKADGVPLFLEELTKTMLESDLMRETEDAFVLDQGRARIAVPASLHDSLMARLDHLQPYKEVAQTAACIGREFEYALLAEAAPWPESTLHEALRRLEQAGIILRRDSIEEGQYAFKHALLRDAAYESLLNANRQRIHARLLGTLERMPGSAPQVMAQHAAQAGLLAEAIRYWQAAASQSMARPAYREAIAHITQAIEAAARLAPGRERDQVLLSLWVALGQASTPLHGYGNSQTAAAFAQARQLATAIGDSPHRFSIEYAKWFAHYVRGEQDEALETAHRIIEQAGTQDGLRLAGTRTLGISLMMTGAPVLAEQTFTEAERIAQALRDRSEGRRLAVANRFAAEPEVATQFHVALTLWSLGRIDDARCLAQRAVAAAREMGHAHTLGHALAHGAIFAVVSRELPLALALSMETIEFAEKHDMELWRGYGYALHGVAFALQGALSSSQTFLEEGLRSLEYSQTGAMVPVYHAVHARSLALLGRLDAAAAHVRAVEQELQSGSQRYFWSDCQRLLGDYARHSPGVPSQEIERRYQRAMMIAREQQAIAWELEAATSLANWWANSERPGDARRLIAPLLASFTQGMNSTVYQTASNLLGSLETTRRA
jgi:predicted ATPase/class 3 adenylate cyclase